MPIDASQLSPQACERYIRLGKAFSSTDTLAQANRTLNALQKHGAEVAKDGFGGADAALLLDARDTLVAQGVGREEARGARKLRRSAHAEAVRRGKIARLSARSVLRSTARQLRETGGDAADAAALTIDAALAETSALPKGGQAIADQLDYLRHTLEDATVAAAAAGRGGADALAALTQASAALRATEQARVDRRGTPAATERLDLIDGIIVELARSARRAATAAARRLGTPELEHDFALTHLKNERSAKKAPEAPPPPDAEAPASQPA